VVLLAGEFLRAAKPFIEEGVHPQVRLFRQWQCLAVLQVQAAIQEQPQHRQRQE